MLFIDVEGKGPGDEIALTGAGRQELKVTATAESIAPLEKLEIIVNGRVAATVKATTPQKVEFSGTVPVPLGGWIAARAAGPASRYVSDSYAFAQTSPVYVVRDGKRFTSAEDAVFLRDAVDAIWARVEGQRGRPSTSQGRPEAPDGRWRSPAEREKFKAAVDQARAVYEKIATSAGTGQSR